MSVDVDFGFDVNFSFWSKLRSTEIYSKLISFLLVENRTEGQQILDLEVFLHSLSFCCLQKAKSTSKPKWTSTEIYSSVFFIRVNFNSTHLLVVANARP